MDFDNTYRSGLEDWLSPIQTEHFLNTLHINARDVSLETLRTVIRAIYANIPFQNLTMLCRPAEPPTKQQIISDMMKGMGGLCTTSNPFLCALLQTMGFNAGLHIVSMEKPDCHIGLIVQLNEKKYFVDVGNGFPYLEPLELKNNSQHRVLNFEYQLIQTGESWAIQQTVLGSRKKIIDQTFSAKLCHYSAFTRMRKKHYTEVNYGPFLTSIRINLWSHQNGFMLRNKTVLNIPDTKYKLKNETEALLWLNTYLPKPEPLQALLKKSWRKIFDN
ncbi:MAG: arylamine N-acetyltransferase [Gammaproteobacteria bacterium]|nr:arylamine N-acetyltransferase [Gammaproteobacteria bacterium]